MGSIKLDFETETEAEDLFFDKRLVLFHFPPPSFQLTFQFAFSQVKETTAAQLRSVYIPSTFEN